ncbi:MAG: 16S rRNA (adenine(1518)-N(6)/adenine(1519)-N(6))-dimethyltransferase RsmA [Alphaproteobacteria bacterium]|nr:16S rRNA (adenine(1518)-N(6)/adenine(1519)-N(6))-dimethyltransferase RsmA [Alphaproteobacteria bacterium]
MPPALPPIRDVIRRHGLDARRSLGQHFLLDLNLTRRIVHTAGDVDGKMVYEVGPGPGGLTRALLEAGAFVVAVETDARCIDALGELGAHYPGRLTVVEADAVLCDEASLVAPGSLVIANLPYNISTVLLAKWLTTKPVPFADMTLMFQKEVANRILAAPGNKTYGRLSVLAQWRCAVERAFDLPAQAFVPPPKVESTVLRLTPHDDPIAIDPAALERVTAAAFGQRRKMLRSSLKSLVENPVPFLEDLGIAPTDRAEDLTVAQFCAIAARIPT